MAHSVCWYFVVRLGILENFDGALSGITGCWKTALK